MVAVVDDWTLLETMMLTRDRASTIRALRRLADEDVRQRRENMLLNRDLERRPGAPDPLQALEAVSNRLSRLREGRQTIIYLGNAVWSRVGSKDLDLSLLITTLNRNNTAVYPLDPSGLKPGSGGSATDDLRALAEHTGGRAIVNTNRIKEGLAGIADRLERLLLARLHESGARRWQVPQNRRDRAASRRAGAGALGLLVVHGTRDRVARRTAEGAAAAGSARARVDFRIRCLFESHPHLDRHGSG